MQALGILDIHSIQDKHVEVQVQVEGRAKTLDHGDAAASTGGCMGLCTIPVFNYALGHAQYPKGKL